MNDIPVYDPVKGGWIGIDLDGTLAEAEEGVFGPIGKPIPKMVEFVNRLIAAGWEVRIFTARWATSGPGASIADVRHWCAQHFGNPLTVTAIKDKRCFRIYDDRARQVVYNTGEIVDLEMVNAALAAAKEDAYLGNQLVALLTTVVGDHGQSEGAVECLTRILNERNAYRLGHQQPSDHTNYAGLGRLLIDILKKEAQDIKAKGHEGPVDGAGPFLEHMLKDRRDMVELLRPVSARVIDNGSGDAADENPVECLTRIIDEWRERWHQLQRAQHDVQHWKNNHASMVALNKLLRDRPDMPAHRLAAYRFVEDLMKENVRLIEERDAARETMNERNREALLAITAAENERDAAKASSLPNCVQSAMRQVVEQHNAALGPKQSQDEVEHMRNMLAIAEGERDALNKWVEQEGKPSIVRLEAERDAALSNLLKSKRELDAIQNLAFGNGLLIDETLHQWVERMIGERDTFNAVNAEAIRFLRDNVLSKHHDEKHGLLDAVQRHVANYEALLGLVAQVRAEAKRAGLIIGEPFPEFIKRLSMNINDLLEQRDIALKSARSCDRLLTLYRAKHSADGGGGYTLDGVTVPRRTYNASSCIALEIEIYKAERGIVTDPPGPWLNMHNCRCQTAQPVPTPETPEQAEPATVPGPEATR